MHLEIWNIYTTEVGRDRDYGIDWQQNDILRNYACLVDQPVLLL
jgi:hypothetical protein